MKLHLLRHAKTESQSISGKDFDRKLAEKGILQAEELSKNINLSRLPQVLCSSSARTRQTFELISKDKFGGKKLFSEELYLASRMEILNLINLLDPNEELMLIGHNEGISDFATYLCGDFIHFKTAEYLIIDAEIDSWKELSAGLGKVIFRYRPEIQD